LIKTPDVNESTVSARCVPVTLAQICPLEMP
jgi:hypothetical protein